MKRHRWVTLYDRIKDIKNPIGVELGVHRAEMSRNLLLLHPGLTLIMVDAWSPTAYNGKDESAAKLESIKNYQEACDENYLYTVNQVAEFKRTAIMRMRSMQAVKLFKNSSFDFVFIDAAHDEESVRVDIDWWMPRVKPGGWLCGHDYGYYEGVKKAVDRRFSNIEIDEDYTWFKRAK